MNIERCMRRAASCAVAGIFLALSASAQISPVGQTIEVAVWNAGSVGGSLDPLGSPVTAPGAQAFFVFDGGWHPIFGTTLEVKGESFGTVIPGGTAACNPTSDPSVYGDCEYIELASFFPFDGKLPEDGRIAGNNPTFSIYFLVDRGLAGGGAGTGIWCGFRPPVMNAHNPDGPMSTFREGRAIPLKFLVAEGADGDCRAGPFIAPEDILLSIARVDPDFEEQQIVCIGGACGEAPYFEAPNNPRAGFHMNVRTDGFEPGIYQATLLATNGEFPVSWTYFEVVP